MNRSTWRYLLPVVLPILAAAAVQGPETLTADLTTVRAGGSVELDGALFFPCDPGDDATSTGARASLTSDPGGITFGPAPIGARGDFDATATVPAGASPGTYTISASCRPLRPGDVIAASVQVEVLADPTTVDEPTGVDEPTEVDEPTDGPATGTPSTGGPIEPGVDPGSGVTGPGSAAVVSVASIAALLAIPALLLARSARRRRATDGAATSVHVRSRTGVVVGPTAAQTAPRGAGVRVLPRPDTGHRTLRHRAGGHHGPVDGG